MHDANFVAAMLASGIDQIRTLDDADFRRFGSLIALVAP